MTAEDQEQRFRGSISLTANDQIRIDHAEIVVGDLLLKVVQVAQVKEEPWPFGENALDAHFQGESDIAEYNELLAL